MIIDTFITTRYFIKEINAFRQAFNLLSHN